MNDAIAIKKLTVDIQENGIIRAPNGRLIAKLVNDIKFDSEHLEQRQETRPHETIVMLPCPFCGGDDIKIMKHRTNNGEGLDNWDYHTISCRNPECFQPSGSDIELDDVIRKWNNRGYIDED